MTLPLSKNGRFRPIGSPMPFLAVLLAVLLVASPAGAAGKAESRTRPPEPGIYRLGELTSSDAARLNREKTMVILPVAPFQTHGPHLPAGTNLILAEALAGETATRIRGEKPEYSVLILPGLPVGAGVSNEMGNIYAHPSAITMDSDILLTFLYDWILNPAENAFWNFFILSTHPGAENMRVLGEVCDFFAEVYGMNTVNVMSLVLADTLETTRLSEAMSRRAPKTPASAPLFELHGGLLETSLMLAVDPDRVEPGINELAPIPVGSFEELTTRAQALGWPGYFGAPAGASAELGGEAMTLLADAAARIILETASGVPWQSRPKLEDELARNFWLRESVRGSEIYQKIKREKFNAWLGARRAVEEENRKIRSGK